MSTAPRKFTVKKEPAQKAATRPEVDPAALAAFANGADASHQDGVMPWEGKDDKRRVNQFVLRLTDAEVAKLRYIGETTKDSMHIFCVRAVRQAIEAGIA